MANNLALFSIACSDETACDSVMIMGKTKNKVFGTVRWCTSLCLPLKTTAKAPCPIRSFRWNSNFPTVSMCGKRVKTTQIRSDREVKTLMFRREVGLLFWAVFHPNSKLLHSSSPSREPGYQSSSPQNRQGTGA